MVVKAKDADYIVNQHLSGFGARTSKRIDNKTSKSIFLKDGKILSRFFEVSGVLMDFLFERYQIDLDMFGYEFNRTTRTAMCRSKTSQGDFCC